MVRLHPDKLRARPLQRDQRLRMAALGDQAQTPGPFSKARRAGPPRSRQAPTRATLSRLLRQNDDLPDVQGGGEN
eukprot:4391236-Pyramimonas_sp.AAC.1